MKEIVEEYGDYLLAIVVVVLVLVIITMVMKLLGHSAIIKTFLQSILGAASFIGGV